MPTKAYFERALALQIGALCLRVEPFSKPPVDWSEQFASLLRLPLVAPRHAHRGALAPRTLLGARDLKEAKALLQELAA